LDTVNPRVPAPWQSAQGEADPKARPQRRSRWTAGWHSGPVLQCRSTQGHRNDAGAATLIDAATVAKLYYASLFTKHFWIDDVYIGIIAKKLGITLTHSDLINSSYRDPRSRLKHDITDMIAVHGLQCPEQLVQLWQTMKVESLSDCSELTSLS